MGTIAEWYGYAATDNSTIAATAASDEFCPFLDRKCQKAGGVCSVWPSQGVVAVCPNRLYYNGHEFLKHIAATAFAGLDLHVDATGLPDLTPGRGARALAAANGKVQVGVFGKGLGSEIKLPPAVDGGARYSVDFTLVAVAPDGTLLAFVPVEVQSVDTTDTYKPSLDALRNGRRIVASDFGMNWENVNKRILPQLIYKGLMLQGERLCSQGIFFVTPEPVYDRIMRRLGGMGRLREVPRQPGSITFIRYQQDMSQITPGSTVPLATAVPITISTSDMSIAFISPQNLPPAGSYERIILGKL